MFESLGFKIAPVEGTSSEDIKAALLCLAEEDCDFSGENGPDYLWENVSKEGYDSNAEYLADTVLKDGSSYEDAIRDYIEGWLDSDGYYHTYEYKIIKDKQGKITHIALAYTYSS